MSHHSLLHNSASVTPNQQTNSQETSRDCASVAVGADVLPKNGTNVRLMVAAVRVSTADGTKHVDTYCLLDSGSQHHVCSKRLAAKLGGVGVRDQRTITGIAGTHRISHSIGSLRVRGLSENDAICLSGVLVLKDLPDISDSVPRECVRLD